MISLIGIVSSIILIMVLAFRRVPLYVYAPLCAMIVAIFSGMDPISTLSTSFASGLGNYVAENLTLFLPSAIFGAFMEVSGAAKCIALRLSALAKRNKNSQFAGLMYMALVQIVLTAGGINVFVIIFLLVSLNRTLYEELDIPWNIYIANMWASSTVTVWALPGMPSIQNLIPTTYLGTTAMAGAGLGIFMGIEITILCILYVRYCLHKAQKNHEHFLPQGEVVKQWEIQGNPCDEQESSLIKALLPSVVVLVAMNGFSISPMMSLLLGSLVTYLLFHKRFQHITLTIRDGIENGLSVLLPVAFMTGYGTVVSATEGFQVVIEALKHIPGPEVLQVFIAVNIASCICGSVSGGLGITLTTLGDYFLSMNLSPGIIHRIAVAGASGLDTMPHAASIHSLLRVSGVEFSWQTYKHLFMCNLVLTIITGLTGVLLVSLGVFA